MALVRWNPRTLSPTWHPFAEFHALRRELDRVFDSFWPFNGNDMAGHTLWFPRVDLMEKDEEYVLYAELPGMKLDDIHIQFHEGVLTLQGERRMEQNGQNGYHHCERAYGSFSRSFMLGSAAEADKISAIYKDGILEIHVPKTAEARTKRIAVQAA